MKTYIGLFFILLFISNKVQSQQLERTKQGYRYNQQFIDKKKLKSLYQKHPDALRSYKKGTQKYGVSSGLIGLGGALLGGNMGYYTATGNFRWKGSSIGLGMVLLGIYTSKGMYKDFDTAVRLFNKKNNTKKPVTLSPSSENLGIQIQF